jgi:hypothetical protein
MPAVSKNELVPTGISTVMDITAKASLLYEQLGLDEKGLSKEAFEFAYKGYESLLEKKMLNQPDYLTICDFSQSAKQKRLYIIDMANDEVLMNTYVAHGHNSGGEYATRFSNRPSSKQSSPVFGYKKYIIGENGLSLRVEGWNPALMI